MFTKVPAKFLDGFTRVEFGKLKRKFHFKCLGGYLSGTNCFSSSIVNLRQSETWQKSLEQKFFQQNKKFPGHRKAGITQISLINYAPLEVLKP